MSGMNGKLQFFRSGIWLRMLIAGLVGKFWFQLSSYKALESLSERIEVYFFGIKFIGGVNFGLRIYL